MSNPYSLPENQPARAGRLPAPETLLVNTNSRVPDSERSFYRVKSPSRARYGLLALRADKGLPLRFTDVSGAEIYVPHHALSSIVYSPGEKND